MNLATIAQQRMDNQRLTHPTFDNPVDAIAWNGAVQSQDYAGAKWAIAQRARHFVSDAAMDQAYNKGAILRTHVMRPTWHFVTPADIRWMLDLTAPRVNAANAYYYRTLELDSSVFAQSNDVMVKALEGGKHLTRAEIGVILQQAGIEALDMRLTYLVMRAELDGVLCSGPRRGKQFTYALLEERVPPAPKLAHDEALAELTRRYFRSHGPALLKDFAWWSGLTLTEAKEGIQLVKSEFHQETVNNESYWSPLPTTEATSASVESTEIAAYLLPNYDEALASFKEYSAATSPQFANMWADQAIVFPHYLVINSWVVGTWKRTLAKKTVTIECKPFAPLTHAESAALTNAANRFGEFLGLSVVMQSVIPNDLGKNVG